MRRVAIVEDHGLIAETVSTALRGRGFDVEVVDVQSAPDLLEAVQGHDPDLVLLDLDLGVGHDALGLLADLRGLGVRVVMVTGVTDRVPLARCVRAGADGIVAKGMAFQDLLDAVETALEHGTLMTRHEREEHLALLRRHEASQHDLLAPFERLTPREADVLRALCHGRSVDAIAADDVVSVSTVRTQVRAILRKLGVSSQLAATALAHESGWLRS